MPKRPLSVTLIGAFVIGYAVLTLLSLAAVRNNPALLTQMISEAGSTTVTADMLQQSFPIAIFICVLIILVGLGLLRGLNWARIAMVAWMILAALMGILQGNAMLLLFASILGVFSMVLYRSPSSAFFQFRKRRETPRNPPDDGNPPSAGSNTGTFVA